MSFIYSGIDQNKVELFKGRKVVESHFSEFRVINEENLPGR